ncbi:MAG: BlaI/MecI/CopY family transcriptional regulator [Planctomycetota bacterium]|jgi:BlaI family penicillinase repressor
MSIPRFGRVQLRIMHVLWSKGRANAREITEALNKEEPIAHSTVQTLLRKLEAKGAVSHKEEDRTFIFFPRVNEKNVARSATREFVDRMFDGSVAGLVSHLLKNERISKSEMIKIKKLIKEEEAG